MTEILDLIKEKILHGLFVCLIIAAVTLLVIAIWNQVIYYLKRNKIESAKQIYNAIKLDEPKDKALALFRDYAGNKDQYMEEALLSSGKREVVLCLLFGFSRNETGEVRLTYVDDRLVQKQQNGIW
ncbi:MAG: hypothetical protein E7425_10875 [Ruminococcaceae bacterium]|nr:hypothetical protein [Oscillospiraceae bacterium]